MKVKWVIEVDGEVHMVEVDHGDYTGKKVITLDGAKVHETGATLLDRGLTHSFYINAHSVEVKIVSNTFTFEYYCTVDGVNIDAVADAEINGAEIAWQFDDAEGDSHQVELRHGARQREVLLDGVSVYKKGGFFSNFFLESDEVEFQVGISPCKIIMREKDLGFEYFLLLQGRELEPTFKRGEQKPAAAVTGSGTGDGAVMHYGRQTFNASPPVAPGASSYPSYPGMTGTASSMQNYGYGQQTDYTQGHQQHTQQQYGQYSPPHMQQPNAQVPPQVYQQTTTQMPPQPYQHIATQMPLQPYQQPLANQQTTPPPQSQPYQQYYSTVATPPPPQPPLPAHAASPSTQYAPQQPAQNTVYWSPSQASHAPVAAPPAPAVANVQQPTASANAMAPGIMGAAVAPPAPSVNQTVQNSNGIGSFMGGPISPVAASASLW